MLSYLLFMLQAVTDANVEFLDIIASHPWSTHDARDFAYSIKYTVAIICTTTVLHNMGGNVNALVPEDGG